MPRRANIGIAGPAIIRLITPEVYHGAAVYVPFLAALATVHALTTMLNHGMMMGRTTFMPLIIDSVAACLALVGYFFLIPSYGVPGAIAATTLALFARLVATYLVSQHLYRIPYPVFRMLALVVLGAGYVLLVGQSSGIFWPLLSAIMAGAGVLLSAVFLNLLPRPAFSVA